MNDLMTKLQAYDWGGDRGSLVEIDDLINTSHGDVDKLAAIEQALLEVLQSEAPVPAKEYSCRNLALIGTANCIPVLAAMLLDPEQADIARLALEAIPDAAADDALQAALDKTEGDQRTGIVNSLDERKKHGMTKTENHDGNENN